VTALDNAECDIPCRAMSQAPIRNSVTENEGSALQKNCQRRYGLSSAFIAPKTRHVLGEETGRKAHQKS
jgi:hypothetical protein